MKKLVCIIIYLCCIFSITNSMAIINNNVIVVDDEGDGDFTSIQDAVDAAKPGDIIEVYSGTYEEHDIGVETENIRLQGMPFEFGNGTDTSKPFIDGMGIDETLEIYAPNVTVDGFHIENDGSGGNVVVGLYQEADGCIISNNTISNCGGSLVWTDGSSTKIIHNNINKSLNRQGIVLSEPSNENIVKGNEISDCVTGILTWGSGGNLIEKNIVTDCERFGIDISNYDNIIQFNTIELNKCGIQLLGIRTTVSNNNFIQNNRNAIFYNTRFSWMLSNRWSGNYWGRPRLLPYPILGQMFLLPWVQFDWRPALLPNQIGEST